MRRALKIIGYLLLALLLLIIGTVLYFMFVFDWSHASGFISSKASDASGRNIAISDGIAVDWGWPVTVITLKGVSIDNTEGSDEPKMLVLPSGEIGVDLSELIKFKLAFTDIVLDSPKLVLEKDKDGNGNWKFGKNPEGAIAETALPDEDAEIPAIGRILIRDGQLRYREASKKTDLKMHIGNFSGEAREAEALKLEGEGTYAGGPLKLSLSGGDLDQLRENKVPYPVDAQFTAGSTSLSVKGTVEDIVQLEGLSLNLTIKGQDAKDLFPLTGIVLPPTPPYSVSGKLGYDKSANRWDFTGFKGRLGDSDLGGDVHWDTSAKRPKLTGNFLSQKLDMDDLAGFIGAPPSTKAGETASAEQKAEAAALDESPYLIPDVSLDTSKVAAMDADVTFKGAHILNKGLPLDDFLLHIVLDDRLLKILPVKFGTADGDITANITVNARKEPVDITMDTTFRKLQLARFFEGAAGALGTDNVTKGNIGGLAKLEGHGKSMREFLSSANGNMGVGMQGGQISHIIVEALGLDLTETIGFFVAGDKPIPVRCLVADFGVKDGKLASNAIVLDTTDTNISGEGKLDFKTERMNFTLSPHPKDESILSLRAPLHVRGTLKKPEPSIDKTSLLARAGAAVALAFATPVAALLATIETGQGKDSPCGAMIQDLKKEVGDTRASVKNGSKTPLIPKNATPAKQQGVFDSTPAKNAR